MNACSFVLRAGELSLNTFPLDGRYFRRIVLGNGLCLVLAGRIPIERFTCCARKGGALPMDGVQFVSPFFASFLLHGWILAFRSMPYS